jgi:hypothetical protein
MAIDFKVKDVMHWIIVRFTPAFLPGAKKKYYAKAVSQTDLDIHEMASKAAVYNITISPREIEEVFTAALQLIQYLTADGYKIITPLFTVHMRIPGEYSGHETRLPDGVYPEVHMRVAPSFRQYIRKRVEVQFDGINENVGQIRQIVDGRTGLIDQVVTIDDILIIKGIGLKINSDAAHASEAGVYFMDPGGTKLPAKAIVRNESCTLVVISPANLEANISYYVVLYTQTSVTNSTLLLKGMREVKAEFVLLAQV